MNERKGKYSNRLSQEKSPYLLQHSGNPVDWYPWCEEAFGKAEKEDKPVFLSIGYSTCHWCHVMEKESFEDEKVAGLLNNDFVSIKVDREERPDIDNIYMNVCSLLTGSGGWPLTIVMTPGKKPFFAATYVPKETRWGRLGMLDLIPKIKEIWRTRKEEIYKSADEIISTLNKLEKNEKADKIDPEIFPRTFSLFKEAFDPVYGGFGKAPKFPSPQNLLFLLHYRYFYKDEFAVEMVKKTLKGMRLGGIFDQIGFGFHRYSTDEKWLVPHFEKMLYDQAMLTLVYLEAYQVTGESFFSTTAEEILDYVLGCMTSEEGGFFSAEDADSEGSEGKFYLWRYNEINNILTKEEAEIAIKVFNITAEGNYFEELSSEKSGENIPYLSSDFSALAGKMHIPVESLEKSVRNIRGKLLGHRSNRTHPYKDDKILTDWNGLMIAAFAKAGRVLKNGKYTEAAINATGFIRRKMWDGNGKLLHRYRDEDAAINGNLDDYAFFTWGLIELYESSFDAEHLKFAVELTEKIMELFYDEKKGILYFCAEDNEKHITRSSVLFDGAIPSGNSVAFNNLILLGLLTGNDKFMNYADNIAIHIFTNVKKNPGAYTMFLSGLLMLTKETMEIVIAGNLEDDKTKEMVNVVNELYLPNAIIAHNPVNEEFPLIHNIAPYIKLQGSVDGKPTAYVCRDFKCRSPATDADKIIQRISA